MSVLRPMPPRDPNAPHRAATELELFFDLVAVIAIAAVTAAYHHAISAGHGLEMLPNFALMIAAVWWVWMNYTWFASAYDNDDGLTRVLTIVIMTGYLLYAAGASHIFETLDFKYGVAGWVVMRLGMMALWLRAGRNTPGHRRTAMRYFWGIGFAQLLWVLLYLFATGNTAAFFGFGALIFAIEILVPVYAEKAGATPWHRHHIIERYGLLNIIVLGEVLLSISFMFGALYEGHFDWALIEAAIAGILITFVLWWVYFMDEAHLTADTSGARSFIWGYGHVFIYIGGAMVAAGLGAWFDLLTHHSHVDTRAASLALNLPVALYMATLFVIRDMFHDLGWQRLVLPVAAAGFVALGIVGAAPWATALLALLTLALRLPWGDTDSTEAAA